MSSDKCGACSKCNPHKMNKAVTVFGSFPGRIVQIHRQDNGTRRYLVKWQHPSERQPQKGWFNHGELA